MYRRHRQPRGDVLVHAIGRLTFPTSLLSAFMNNTPLVAMMLPVVADWAKKNKVPLSKVMIPLSLANLVATAAVLKFI